MGISQSMFDEHSARLIVVFQRSQEPCSLLSYYLLICWIDLTRMRCCEFVAIQHNSRAQAQLCHLTQCECYAPKRTIIEHLRLSELDQGQMQRLILLFLVVWLLWQDVAGEDCGLVQIAQVHPGPETAVRGI